MITRCDHCGSKFEVSEDLVYSSDPGVRCGDCMSLFDARVNLFDESQVHKEAAAYKPVQQKRMVETDPGILETADTMVSEHYYQRNLSTSGAETALADGEAQAYYDDVGARYDDSDQSSSIAGYRGTGSPDIDLSGPRMEADYPDYRLSETAATDLEFEQTKATESALGVTDLESVYSSEASQATSIAPTAVVDKDLLERKLLAAEEVRQLKQKSVGERERRALAIETPRPGFDAEKMRPVDDSKTRNTNSSKPTDMLAGDAAAVEYGFIPADVLQKPSIYRQDGRHVDPAGSGVDALRSDTNLDRRSGERYPSDRSRGAVEHSNAPTDRRDNNRAADRVDDRRSQRLRPDARRGNFDLQESDSHERKFSRRRADKSFDTRDVAPVRREQARVSQNRKEQPLNDRFDSVRDVRNRPNHARDTRAPVQGRDKNYQQEAPGVRLKDDERKPGLESSAQEMRRYQKQRPAMVVTEHIEGPVVAGAEEASIKQGGFGMRTGLLLCALLAAVCIALFAARNVIANMNLPEPILGGFCQITGCVPDKAKADVDQLETMRKRLYSHPDIENALVISVDMINHSLYKQPYPALVVTLKDAAGEAVAERRFESVDYEVVDRGEAEYLIPEEPTRIKIEVVDTGLGATEVEIEYK